MNSGYKNQGEKTYECKSEPQYPGPVNQYPPYALEMSNDDLFIRLEAPTEQGLWKLKEEWDKRHKGIGKEKIDDPHGADVNPYGADVNPYTSTARAKGQLFDLDPNAGWLAGEDLKAGQLVVKGIDGYLYAAASRDDSSILGVVVLDTPKGNCPPLTSTTIPIFSSGFYVTISNGDLNNVQQLEIKPDEEADLPDLKPNETQRVNWREFL